MYSLAAALFRPVAAALLINRSAAFTPDTGSLKSTVIFVSVLTVALAPGDKAATVGVVLSIKV